MIDIFMHLEEILMGSKNNDKVDDETDDKTDEANDETYDEQQDTTDMPDIESEEFAEYRKNNKR